MRYTIGVQVYTYRAFSVENVCEALDGGGVTAIELMDTHLDPGVSDPEKDRILGLFDDVGIEIAGYYGGSFDRETLSEAEARFAFANDIGATYVACDFPPDPHLGARVAELAAEHDLLVGIHNHGPGATYETVDDVRAIVEETPPRIGACVDTGHFLRVDQPPDHVIPTLTDQIHALHVSDYIGPDTETIPGEGRLDLEELVELLDEHASLTTPLTIEYEGNADEPTPVVSRVAARLRDILT